ncbi:MAG: tRNA (N6-threonylcarbamoyladenosine(37)-N6)-methyltransferase TrmO [Candidatus Hydrogenedentota bacterium]
MYLEPIGAIYSPFAQLNDMPIQPRGAVGLEGTVHIKEDYVEGLRDLEGFSHLILIYWFHLSRTYSLNVIPFLDEQERGLFATRAPRRPNPIGVSVVQLDKVEGAVLHIRNVDMLNGTPLLDIKPYVPDFDAVESPRIGWLEGTSRRAEEVKSDERFT